MIELANRQAPWLVLLAGLGVLVGALGAEHIGGIQPCALCLYQRMPYYAVIAIGLIGLVLARQNWARPAQLGLSALAFLAGAGIAGFHVGVEQHWWAGLASCGGGDQINTAQTVEELRKALTAAPVVRCDEIPWSLFGISLAGFNLIISLGLAGFSLWALMSTRAEGE